MNIEKQVFQHGSLQSNKSFDIVTTDKNTWYNITVCKLFVLRIVIIVY